MKQMLRVMQHDTCDQIRIGMAFYCTDIKKAVDNAIESYDKDMAWCGGFKEGCEKYYKRIALVDAETLKVVKMIWEEEK